MTNLSNMPKKWSSGMHFISSKSIGFRLIAAFIAIIILVLLTITVISVIREDAKERGRLTNKGKTMVRLLATSARIGIFSENRDRLKEAADAFVSVRDVLFIGIYGADGKPLYLSDPAFPGNDNAQENDGKAGSAEAMHEVPVVRGNHRTLEFSRPVVLTIRSNEVMSLYFGDSDAGTKEQVIGYVKLVIGQESLKHEIMGFALQNVVIVLLFSCASIVIVYFWVRKITKPLETLTREISALGKGSDVPHVPVETTDEIGRLAKAFNTMLDERKTEEQARKNILRDLHDGVGGMMTNIVILSEIAQTRSLPEDVAKTLATISGLSREGINEIRSLIYSLDRSDLTWPSIIAEMRSQGNKIAEPHGIAFEMTAEVDEGAGSLSSLLCLHLFKIYHESLTNVIKHSHAAKVWVGISVRTDRLLLSVQDNGRGCDDTQLSSRGRGITNMRTRAAEMGGVATITGDSGTCVSVDIPFVKKSIGTGQNTQI
jgi:signal transduction histidine kinase